MYGFLPVNVLCLFSVISHSCCSAHTSDTNCETPSEDPGNYRAAHRTGNISSGFTGSLCLSELLFLRWAQRWTLFAPWMYGKEKWIQRWSLTLNVNCFGSLEFHTANIVLRQWRVSIGGKHHTDKEPIWLWKCWISIWFCRLYELYHGHMTLRSHF